LPAPKRERESPTLRAAYGDPIYKLTRRKQSPALNKQQVVVFFSKNSRKEAIPATRLHASSRIATRFHDQNPAYRMTQLGHDRPAKAD
jgi:predicted metallopeptidase